MTIDDKLPFLERSSGYSSGTAVGQAKENVDGVNKEQEKGETSYVPLYPMTGNLAELWPALLFKAILKVVALE